MRIATTHREADNDFGDQVLEENDVGDIVIDGKFVGESIGGPCGVIG